MTKNYILSALALITIGLGAEARVLDPDEALDRAISGTGAVESPQHVRSRAASTRTLVHTALTERAAEPAAYAFDLGRGEGFMLVSADDNAYPLLGYSDTGSLAGELPDGLQWLLSEYAAQIEYAREHPAAVAYSAPQRINIGGSVTRDAIGPLLTTSWDQGEPYNNKCPKYGSEKTYTGCVATAMAQVMNYWQYPDVGTGSISYNAASVDKRLSMTFSNTRFDWGNMITSYNGSYTDAQADAVATLMKACGYAVKMDYGVDSSGALSMAVPYALKKYFGYDPNMRHEIRALYTSSQWDELMYTNLRDCGPIMYGGGSMIGGGHSFVCDGYDGLGFYHFNWGWTGMSDGYFSLDALNPYALGAGGGGGGGYNFTQDAVFGIRPATGDPVVERDITLVQHGSLAGYIKDGKLIFDLYAESSPMWVSYNYLKYDFIFGAKVEKVGDTSFQPVIVDVNDKIFGLDGGYGTSPSYTEFSITPGDLNLTDGTYKVTMMLRQADAEQYVSIRPCSGYSDFLYLTKQGDSYDVVLEDCWRLDVVEAKPIGNIYYGMASQFEITVVNDSPIQMSRGFAPCLLNPQTGEVTMLGESIFVTIDAGRRVTRKLTTEMYQLDQYFTVEEDVTLIFTLFDESTYNIWEEILVPVVVHPNAGQPGIQLIAPPEVVNGTYDNANQYWVVDDKNEIKVKTTLQLVSGGFGYEVLACFVEDDGASIADYSGNLVYLSQPGATADFSTTVHFKSAQPGKTYLLMMAYSYMGYVLQIGPYVAQVHIPEAAGVDDVTVDGDADAPVEYYNLQGIRVETPQPGGIYIRRQGTKSTKVIM